MKVERAVAALKEIREGAQRMVEMYETEVIPKVVGQLNDAKAQLSEHRLKVIEIDEMLARVGDSSSTAEK